MSGKIKYPDQGFQIPRCRYVRGSMVKKYTTDHKKQPLPENKHHYWNALAMPKGTPQANDLLNGIIAHTWNTYASVAGNQAVMDQLKLGMAAPSFAWKIDDGDTHPDWSKREGCPGHWILGLATTFELNTFDNRNAALDPACFQLGDYVDGFLTTSINGEVDVRVAGIYLNPKCFRWLDEGPRINVGADVNQMMGAGTGQGYYRSQTAAPAMSGQMTGAQPPQAAPGQYQAPPPGQYQQPAPPPPVQAAPPPETDEQWNVRHTGHPAPGYRWNPATAAWDVAPTPAAPPPPAQQAYAAPQAPAPGYGNVPQYGATPSHGQIGTSQPGNAPAYGQGAPVYGQQHQGAPAVGHGGPQGTAYPSNYGPGNPPPGVQQQNYAGGPPRVG